MNEESKTATHANPWRFFALALGLSWLFWIPLALLGQEAMGFPFVILMIAGGLSPAIAEIILIARSHDRAQWRDYRQRVLDFRRISAGWWAVILLTFLEPFANQRTAGF